MRRGVLRAIGYVSRAPFLLVMPESKLWIGPYRCFHHAYQGLQRQADPSKWFIVPATWKPPGWQLIDPWAGWMQLDDAHPFGPQPKLKPATVPCKNGHISPRYANRGCRQCRLERGNG